MNTVRLLKKIAQATRIGRRSKGALFAQRQGATSKVRAGVVMLNAGFTPHLLRTVKSWFWRKAQSSKSAGFTLVEILVAIFLLSIALTAATSVLTFNARSATTISNNFVASGLAQEGIEVVRNIRDRDWLLGNSFGTSLPDGAYRVIYSSNSLMPVGSNPNLKRDAVTGVFNYDAGNDTIFKRSVTVSTTSSNPSNVEKRIIVNVTWPDRGGITKSVSAEDHLFNWK